MATDTLPIDTKDVVFPSTPFPLNPHLILLGRRGSEAHGLYIPSSGSHDGIDDRDLMGVVIPPSEYYLGLQHWDGAEAMHGVWDVVLYELRKFVRLLMQQNPNVLQMLWLEDEDYLPVVKQNRVTGLSLIRSRMDFRHARHARNAFLGYAESQLKRMTAFDQPAMQRIADLEHVIEDDGINLGHAAEGKVTHPNAGMQAVLNEYAGMRRKYHKAYMGKKRWALVQEYGYDTKNAAHLVRLLHIGYEYLTHGRMQVRRTWDRTMLLEIKRGEWELSRVQEHAANQFAAVREAKSVLPESIDEDRISKIVAAMVEEQIM